MIKNIGHHLCTVPYLIQGDHIIYVYQITTYLLPQIFRPSYGPVPTEEERLKIEPYKLNYRYIHFSCYRYYCASTSSESKFLRLFTLWSHLFQVRKGRGDMKN